MKSVSNFNLLPVIYFMYPQEFLLPVWYERQSLMHNANARNKSIPLILWPDHLRLTLFLTLWQYITRDIDIKCIFWKIQVELAKDTIFIVCFVHQIWVCTLKWKLAKFCKHDVLILNLWFIRKKWRFHLIYRDPIYFVLLN